MLNKFKIHFIHNWAQVKLKNMATMAFTRYFLKIFQFGFLKLFKFWSFFFFGINRAESIRSITFDNLEIWIIVLLIGLLRMDVHFIIDILFLVPLFVFPIGNAQPFVSFVLPYIVRINTFI